jgi:hypothetical protein
MAINYDDAYRLLDAFLVYDFKLGLDVKKPVQYLFGLSRRGKLSSLL